MVKKISAIFLAVVMVLLMFSVMASAYTVGPEKAGDINYKYTVEKVNSLPETDAGSAYLEGDNFYAVSVWMQSDYAVPSITVPLHYNKAHFAPVTLTDGEVTYPVGAGMDQDTYYTDMGEGAIYAYELGDYMNNTDMYKADGSKATTKALAKCIGLGNKNSVGITVRAELVSPDHDLYGRWGEGLPANTGVVYCFLNVTSNEKTAYLNTISGIETDKGWNRMFTFYFETLPGVKEADIDGDEFGVYTDNCYTVDGMTDQSGYGYFVNASTSVLVNSNKNVVSNAFICEHTNVTWTTTIPATCTDAGEEAGVCAVCGEAMGTRPVPATGAHNYEPDVTPPTCTEQGYTTYICSVCKDSYKSDYVDPTDHVYVEVVDEKAVTCTEDGYVTKVCGCGERNTTVVPATGEHVYVEVEGTRVPATCMAAGSVMTKCGCGDEKEEVLPIDAANHTGKTTLVGAEEATCGADGYTGDTVCECGETIEKGEVVPATEAHVGGTATCMAQAVCAECGTAYGEKDAANHTGKTTLVGKVEATCGADGYTGDTVCECGATIEKGTVDPATGKHDHVERVTKQPSCTRTGTMTYECACGDKYTETIPALNHKNADGSSAEVEIPAVEATCSDYGYTAGAMCTLCNTQTIVPTQVPKADHAWDNGVVTEPTYTSQGYTTYTCGNCGETKDADFVPALKAEYSLSIKQPSITKIRCKDTIVLHADFEGADGATVVWTADNANFVMTDLGDGKLEITSAENGFTVFTATLVDADGNELASDTVEMQSKADIWGKIGGFFRMLFGSTLYYNY